MSKCLLDSLVTWTSRHQGSTTYLWRLLVIELVLVIADDGLSRLSALCEAMLGDRISTSVSLRFIQHSTELDLASFENPVFQDKLDRARRQIGRFSALSDLLRVGNSLVCLLFVSTSLAVQSPSLILVLIATVLPAFLGEARYSAISYSALFRQTPRRRMLDYLCLLGASARAAKEVRVFQFRSYVVDSYRRLSEFLLAENRRLALRRAIGGSILNLISTLGFYGAQAMVLWRTMEGQYSIGMFTFLILGFSKSRSCIDQILSAFRDITEQVVFYKDLFEVFDLKPRIRSTPGAITAPRPIRDGFEFCRVSFAYPGSDRLIIKDLTIRFEPNSRTAMIGENGCGKTTIAKLLARLYDPTTGRILLDGIDLREYDVEDLRSQITTLFQDYMCYDLSVRENIGLGSVGLADSRARVRDAARKGEAMEIIARLPNGFEQTLGTRFDGGLDLSGGEWQKMALARAYMKDAQLLVLDEPTAAVDARAESAIFERFAELASGRTTVLISHRFSTVRMADQILVLGDGVIEDYGTHRQLLARGGRYAELFELQAAGYR